MYFIDVYGIGPKAFRGITATNQEQYQQVIGCADMYRDAPYRFPKCIADVERTLPTWSGNSFKQVFVDDYKWTFHEAVVFLAVIPVFKIKKNLS